MKTLEEEIRSALYDSPVDSLVTVSHVEELTEHLTPFLGDFLATFLRSEKAEGIFKKAWHEADARKGGPGTKVKAGLAALAEHLDGES